MNTPQDTPRTTAREEAEEFSKSRVKNTEGEGVVHDFTVETYLTGVKLGHKLGRDEMLEAVLRELRSVEARTMHMSQLKSAPIWPTDWARFIESRFKDLANGQEKSE